MLWCEYVIVILIWEKLSFNHLDFGEDVFANLEASKPYDCTKF